MNATYRYKGDAMFRMYQNTQGKVVAETENIDNFRSTAYADGSIQMHIFYNGSNTLPF